MNMKKVFKTILFILIALFVIYLIYAFTLEEKIVLSKK